MNNQISLTVNGIQHTLEAKPNETLSTLLRERLRLTGTKIGCGEAECGACTVLVDGEPVVSCIYPAASILLSVQMERPSPPSKVLPSACMKR